MVKCGGQTLNPSGCDHQWDFNRLTSRVSQCRYGLLNVGEQVKIVVIQEINLYILYQTSWGSMMTTGPLG